MSVKLHAVIFCVLGFGLFFAIIPVVSGSQSLMATFLSRNGLEEMVGEPLPGWISVIAHFGTFIAVFMVLGNLFDSLLTRVYPALVPAFCSGPGCRGRTHIVRGPKSYVYVCDKCGAYFDTHFSIGGDD